MSDKFSSPHCASYVIQQHCYPMFALISWISAVQLILIRLHTLAAQPLLGIT